MTSYFDQLFTAESIEGVHEVIEVVRGGITEVMLPILNAEFTREEAFNTLKQMHPIKAPGPNGMPALFY